MEREEIEAVIAELIGPVEAEMNALATDQERFQYVENMCAERQIVFGVWADQTKARGFDYYIIKGINLIKESLASDTAFTPTIGVVPCVGRANAIAAADRFEDKMN